MNDGELAFVGRQALYIEKLETTIKEQDAAIKKAISYLICFGGPFNDNTLQFDKKQIGYLFKVLHALEGYDGN